MAGSPKSLRSARASTRRGILAGSGSLLLLSTTRLRADPAEMHDAMRKALGDRQLKEGRVALDIPALVENGNSVPLTITVASPMTVADHVATIDVFSPENPLPNISRFHLGPRSGKAEIRTTIRLATTQIIHVVATLSDGSCWLATAEVEVTTAACFDPT